MYRLSVVTLHDVIPEPPPEPEPTEGLYTEQEITDMINNDDFIPVATAAELNALRNAVTQTMGAGTIWEAQYLTGLDKKYVQVDDVDFEGSNTILGTSGVSPTGFHGTYDGNELSISNTSQAIFRAYGGTYRNIIILNAVLSGAGLANEGNLGVLIDLIFGSSLGGNTLVENCHGKGSVSRTSSSQVSGCGGLIGYAENVGYSVTVDNCSFDGDVENLEAGTTARHGAGGLIGITRNDPVNVSNSWVKGTVKNLEGNFTGGLVGTFLNAGTVEKCWTDCDVQGVTSVAGLIGEINRTGAILRKSHAYGSVIGTGTWFGGACGLLRIGSIQDSYSHAAVSKGATGDQLGGFVGRILSGQTVSNCYSTGLVTAATGSSIGGFCGLQQGTLTNSYYDTQTSGRSDTGKGLPRTTLQMQQGTADSFILPAGGEDTGEDAANAMYTGWDIAIWEFEPDTEYPELL